MFRKYAIDTTRLQGHWLRLVTPEECLSLASGEEHRRNSKQRLPEEEEASEDVRLVRLY